MPFISLTRLRLRSVRYLPFFAVYAFRTLSQVKAARGFQGGSLLADRKWTFWTLTSWDRQESMRQYMTSGAHMAAMPKLMHWCDEASVAHWERASDDLPAWIAAEEKMREIGRCSKVLRPSPQHASLGFARAQPWGRGPIQPNGHA